MGYSWKKIGYSLVCLYSWAENTITGKREMPNIKKRTKPKKQTSFQWELSDRFPELVKELGIKWPVKVRRTSCFNKYGHCLSRRDWKGSGEWTHYITAPKHGSKAKVVETLLHELRHAIQHEQMHKDHGDKWHNYLRDLHRTTDYWTDRWTEIEAREAGDKWPYYMDIITWLGPTERELDEYRKKAVQRLVSATKKPE